MKEVKETNKRIHHGHNFARLRKASGKKQSALAQAANMSQQTWSRYEQKRVIEEEVLVRMAKALEVPVEVVKQMEEDPMTFIIENNDFHDKSAAGNVVIEGDQITNNPIDAILELQSKNEELHRGNRELYERLLKAEQEKNVYLERLVKKYGEG